MQRSSGMVLWGSVCLAITLMAPVPRARANGCATPIPGDFDCDTDVDLDDLARMDTCRSGPSIPFSALPGCQAPDSDFDLDSDVDLEDFGAFQRCFSGADEPADPDCIAHTVFIQGGCLNIIGTPASSELALRLQPGSPSTLQIDVGDNGSPEFSFDRGLFDCIVVNAGGGNDLVRIDETNGIFTDTETTTIQGGKGIDTLIGGSGGETFSGGAGDDMASLGAGPDIFLWEPGDGSDTVEGQAGTDMMRFLGSDATESIDVAAVGGKIQVSRDLGGVTLDLNHVEICAFQVLGGADHVVVGDLSDTEATLITLDLRGPQGSGDGQADIIEISGTPGDDVFGATGSNGAVSTFGLHAQVIISFAEPAMDRLALNALGGDDVVDATSLEADAIGLTIYGGLGGDLLIGGEGDDLVDGEDGDDLALLGPGNDTFVWNPGDDNDTVEGQDGFDTMLFNGANANENVTVSANGGRVRFSRDVASVIMDLNDVEQIDFNALGGSDAMVINDLSGTDMIAVNLHLAALGGGGDAQPDTVIVNGTNGDDTLLVVGSAGEASVLGLAAQCNITGSEAANDRLVINALGGRDVIEASGLPVGIIQLTGDGGDDDDVLIGSDGPDILLGGNGDDVLLGGLGIDILDGGPGDNVVIQ
jgi:Ca2+-binding RTX toxin-like protein